MSSDCVAEAAARYGLPLAAIRVVCDPATRSVPELALRSIRADGSTDIASLLRALYREPAHISGLLRVALDARAARESLLRCVRTLEPDLEVSDALRISGEVVGLQSRFGTATGQA